MLHDGNMKQKMKLIDSASESQGLATVLLEGLDEINQEVKAGST
jgi:hypothetical protein